MTSVKMTMSSTVSSYLKSPLFDATVAGVNFGATVLSVSRCIKANDAKSRIGYAALAVLNGACCVHNAVNALDGYRDRMKMAVDVGKGEPDYDNYIAHQMGEEEIVIKKTAKMKGGENDG